MTEPIIQFGIVGFGRIVELIHMPTLKRLGGIKAAGVYDITAQRRDLAVKRGLEAFAELDGLLSSPIDAVLIATPHQSHFELAKQCLQSGKHVILEKPVTLTYAEAVQLQKVASDCGRAVTVFHNRRFDRDYQLVKQVIEEGELGPLLFIDRRHHSFGSGASFGVKSFHPDWRNEADYGGGALLDWGVHLIDQLLRLEIGKFAEIDAALHNLRWRQGDAEDYVRASIKTDRDILLSFEINFGSHAASPLWVVGGENGTLEIDTDKEAVLHIKGKPAQSIELTPSLYDGAQTIYESFVKHLTEGAPLAITMDEAVETMAVADAIRISAERRQGVRYGDLVLGATS
ncbi:Gfo/Idh/MocA family oxidoreductase [Paenibacillus sp. M1]|uniref:Gfo/Idh/MocA family oxidoreductase n=1 Tax=Paenibacillus haidiansis TaxID=1574488 RepID=A0ABU7VQR9_9BACL